MADDNETLETGVSELSIDQLDQVSGGFIPVHAPVDNSAPGTGNP